MAACFMVFCAFSAQGQTQVTNTAVVSPPVSVTNTGAGCTGGTCTAADIDTVSPSLPTVSKSFSLSSINAGGTALLTITISNTHALVSATLSSVFTDNYPTGLVNAATPAVTTTGCSAGLATAVAGAGSLSLPSGTLIPQASTCTVTVVVTSSVGGSLTNTIPSGSLTTSVGSNSATVSAAISVTTNADLSVTKVISGAAVQGSTVSYTVTLVNLGPSTAVKIGRAHV